MKRLFRIAAVAVLAGSLFASGEALAEGKGRGHGNDRGRPERSERQARGGEQRDWRGDRGNRSERGDRGGYRGERDDWRDRSDRRDRDYRGGRDDRGGREDRGGRRWDAGPPDAYAPPGFARRQPPANYGVRRGGQAPPEYRGAEVSDYGRHRLRPPPPGYTWVRMGNRYALVSRSTGQIFDVIGD